MVPGLWLEACQWYSFFIFFSSHHCPLTLDRPSPACSLLPRERTASKWTNPADHRKSQPQSVRRCLNIGGWCCFGLSKMFNSFVIALLLAMNGYVICIHMIGSTDLGCILLSALRIGLVHTAVIRWKDAGLCNVSRCLFELRPSTTISRIVPCAKITRLKPSEAEETRGNKRLRSPRL